MSAARDPREYAAKAAKARRQAKALRYVSNAIFGLALAFIGVAAYSWVAEGFSPSILTIFTCAAIVFGAGLNIRTTASQVLTAAQQFEIPDRAVA